MDLSTLDTIAGSDEGAVMTVRHPATNEPIEGMWIRVAGPDSTIAKQRRAMIRRKMRGSRSGQMDYNWLDEEARQTRVATTLEWRDISVEGKLLECTPDNVRKVYERFPWIAEQVDEFQADRANFLQSVLIA